MTTDSNDTTITIGIRVIFHDGDGKHVGDVISETGFRAVAVPQAGDPISLGWTTKETPADAYQIWPCGPLARVHHVEHYPVLASRGDEPTAIVVIHMPAPGDVTAGDLVRLLRTSGWQQISAAGTAGFDGDHAWGRAVRADRRRTPRGGA